MRRELFRDALVRVVVIWLAFLCLQSATERTIASVVEVGSGSGPISNVPLNCTLFIPSNSTSCTPPSTFDYIFNFDMQGFSCSGAAGTMDIYLEMSPTSTDPWTVIDEIHPGHFWPLGQSSYSGTFADEVVPPGYAYYRIRLIARPLSGGQPTSIAGPAPLCMPPVATVTPTTCPVSWTQANSPNPGSSGNFLYGIDALSDMDAWAVGSYSQGASRGMTLHWDGVQWVNVPNTAPGTSFELLSVKAFSSNDVWAAGYSIDGSTRTTLTLHWDGNQWSVVGSPSPGTFSGLYAIDGTSSADIWAVGATSSGGNVTYTLHWNGSEWTEVPSTFPGTLLGVAAIAPDDVWAIGNNTSPIAIHWDGTNWTQSSVPGLGTLRAVSALSSIDVWAVGYTGTEPNTQTRVLRWNGTQWDIVTSPNPGSIGNQLRGVKAVSANEVWAVGYAYPEYDVPNYGNRTLILRWTGSNWSEEYGPNPGLSLGSFLYSVSRVTSNIWAAGSYIAPGNPYRTLISRRGSVCQTPSATATTTPTTTSTLTPTMTATSTASVTATRTPTPYPCGYSADLSATCTVPGTFEYNFVIYPHHCQQTNTGGATVILELAPAPEGPWTSFGSMTHELVVPYYGVTSIDGSFASVYSPPDQEWYRIVLGGQVNGWPIGAQTAEAQICLPPTCTISFTDVPDTHTFYVFIRCLACRSILSGYSDGTFRPGNDVTRGQLSKIVANAANMNEPVSGQRFSDVPTTHTFYEFIERMARRGIIGGYSDGTFRPGNSATRGQIAKIVANAANMNEPVNGQIFLDVPPSHPFYEFIERIAGRGIIGGYSDGTFRPQNNATRGQVSKIVANTFLPDCNP